MPATPAGNSETFTFADLLVAVFPFVLGVGLLSGLLAAVLVVPVALWTDGRFSPPSSPSGRSSRPRCSPRCRGAGPSNDPVDFSRRPSR